MGKAASYAKAAQLILDEADDAGRAPTSDERSEVLRLLEKAEASGHGPPWGALSDQQQALLKSIPAASPGSTDPGSAFIHSQEYFRVKDRSSRSGAWSSGEVEVPHWQVKGTMLEGATPGGGPLVQPDTRAGVVTQLFQPVTVADALTTETTTSSVVRYVSEQTVVTTAAPTPEAGSKPEATLSLT